MKQWIHSFALVWWNFFLFIKIVMNFQWCSSRISSFPFNCSGIAATACSISLCFRTGEDGAVSIPTQLYGNSIEHVLTFIRLCEKDVVCHTIVKLRWAKYIEKFGFFISPDSIDNCIWVILPIFVVIVNRIVWCSAIHAFRCTF